MDELSLELHVDARGVVTLRLREDPTWSDAIYRAIPALVRCVRMLGFDDVLIEVVRRDEW